MSCVAERSTDSIDRTIGEPLELVYLATALNRCDSRSMIVHADRRILSVNQAFVVTTGYEFHDVLGKEPSFLVADTSGAIGVSSVWTSVQQRGAWQGELEMCRHNGQSFPAWLMVSPVRDAQGLLTHYICTAIDIADRKQMESFRAAKEAAEAANRAKSEFVANMSHEIRTPMNGVLGMTELLLDTGLTDTQRRYAQNVRKSGEALLHIINDILDFSKIEAGKLEIEHADFDVHQLTKEVVELLAGHAEAKGLALRYQIDDAVPTQVKVPPSGSPSVCDPAATRWRKLRTRRMMPGQSRHRRFPLACSRSRTTRSTRKSVSPY